jgi:hypothetical protein
MQSRTVTVPSTRQKSVVSERHIKRPFSGSGSSTSVGREHLVHEKQTKMAGSWMCREPIIYLCEWGQFCGHLRRLHRPPAGTIRLPPQRNYHRPQLPVSNFEVKLTAFHRLRVSPMATKDEPSCVRCDQSPSRFGHVDRVAMQNKNEGFRFGQSLKAVRKKVHSKNHCGRVTTAGCMLTRSGIVSAS